MENQQIYSAVVTILVMDGGTDVKELQFLQHLRQQLGIPADVARTMLVEARKGKKRIHLPTNPEEKHQLLDYLVQAALANETIDPKEQQALEAVVRTLKLPREELSRVITRHMSSSGTPKGTLPPLRRTAQNTQTTPYQQQDRMSRSQSRSRNVARKDDHDDDEALIREVEEYQRGVRQVLLKCILMSCFCVALPYIIVAFLLPFYQTWNALKETVSTPATLHSVELYASRSRDKTVKTRRWKYSYTLNVTYSYEYNGQRYTSDRITMSPILMSNDYKKEMSSRLKSAHKQGSPVECYVSVAHPDIAVLDTQFYIVPFLIGTLGAFAIVAALGTIVLGFMLKVLGKFPS